MSTHPESQQPTITLIANPYSVHVLRWLQLYKKAGIHVRIESPERKQEGGPAELPIEHLAPGWVPGPSIMRYVRAGRVARKRPRSAGEILHAHCTSGSGFTALRSRHPYIVTTYGSEVFGAAERGWMYRWMIKRVLRGASLVTATTPKMVSTLTEMFGVPAERIRMFSLGYDVSVFSPVEDKQRRTLRRELDLPSTERVWVINRRSLSLYRTVEVVSGFLKFCQEHADGQLVVLSGDDDPTYSQQLRDVIAASHHKSRVHMVSKFLSAEGVAQWLRAADFAISVPKTDQLSTSILEAMACGAVPVLSDLEAYQQLHDCDAVHRVTDYTTEGFARMFDETWSTSTKKLLRHRQQCAEFVASRFLEASILDQVRELYGLNTPEVTVTMRQAKMNSITVIGAVNEPKTYKLRPGSSDVLSAIVHAGGLAENAGTMVEIRHPGFRNQLSTPAIAALSDGALGDGIVQAGYQDAMPSSAPQSVRIDLITATQQGQAGQHLPDGSIVMVESRDPEAIRVMGLVSKPNEYKYPVGKELMLLDAIALAGGTANVVANKVYIVRKKPGSDETILIEASIRKAKNKRGLDNPRLAPGDVVSVEQTPLTAVFEALRLIGFGVNGRAF